MAKVAVLTPSMGEQGSTNVFHVEGRTFTARKPYEVNFVNSLAFSSDGAQIVIGGHDKTVKVWDWRTNAMTVLFFDQPIAGVAFFEGKHAEFIVAADSGETWTYRIVEAR